MREGATLAVVAALTATGLALRTAPPSPSPVTAPTGGGRTLLDVTGEVRGRLVHAAGCEGDVWVATIPGYLTAVPPSDVDWGRGPAVATYAFAGRHVAAGSARTVMLTARVGELAAAAVGLRWGYGGLVKVMAPPGCRRAAQVEARRVSPP